MVLKECNFSVEKQKKGVEGIYEIITKAGYTCYKTQKEITENGSKKFIENLIKSGHLSVLEHGTVYLKTTWNTVTDFREKVLPIKYQKNNFSKVNFHEEGDNNITAYITTNYRVLVENGWLDDLKFLCEPTEYHEKRVCVRFWMDRVGTQSVMRHRGQNGVSFSQESTRFCNYTNEGKFGDEGIKIAVPHWFTTTDSEKLANKNVWENVRGVHEEYLTKRELSNESKTEKALFDKVYYWFAANDFCDFCYAKLINCGMNAEDARAVLPLDLYSEFVMTAFVSDWKHFFDLRADGTTGRPHPDINRIAVSLKQAFESENYI